MPIDLASALATAQTVASTISATISVHDASGTVLFGTASPTVYADVPPMRGTATIPGKRPTPGFSTRANPVPGPNAQTNQFLLSSAVYNVPPVRIQRFAYDQPMAIDFTLSRVERFFVFIRVVQIRLEIETLNAPGGNRVQAVGLNVQESGVLMRAFGPSVLDPNVNAVYTVTVDVVPIVG